MIPWIVTEFANLGAIGFAAWLAHDGASPWTWAWFLFYAFANMVSGRKSK